MHGALHAWRQNMATCIHNNRFFQLHYPRAANRVEPEMVLTVKEHTFLTPSLPGNTQGRARVLGYQTHFISLSPGT